MWDECGCIYIHLDLPYQPLFVKTKQIRVAGLRHLNIDTPTPIFLYDYDN
jgi:hypothetical protein